MSEDMPKQVTEMNMARCLVVIPACPFKTVLLKISWRRILQTGVLEKGIVSFAAGSDSFLIKQKYKKYYLPNNSIIKGENFDTDILVV
jgi:hypothetical protein